MQAILKIQRIPNMNWTTTYANVPASCPLICDITIPAQNKFNSGFAPKSLTAYLIPVQFRPRMLLCALLNRFAQQQFLVPRCECRKFSWRLKISRLQIIVKIMEELHERVGISFCMPSGIRSIRPRRRTEQRRILYECFVRLISPADPERVRLFRIPSQ